MERRKKKAGTYHALTHILGTQAHKINWSLLKKTNAVSI